MAIAPLANVTTPLLADIVLPSILILSTCKSPVIKALPTTSNSFPDVGVELVSDVGFINKTAVEMFTGELTINEEKINIALWRNESYGKESFSIQATKVTDE